VCAPGDPPVSTTVPLAGSLADEIVIGPASTSVSFVSTGIDVAAASSSNVAESLTATGGSSTATTSIVRVSLPVAPGWSVAAKVTVRSSTASGAWLLFVYVTAASASW
jgi:hypothetical protein